MSTTAPVAPTVDESVAAQETRITAYERCDSNIHERAQWIVQFPDSELAFCNHHYVRFASKFADRRVIRLVDPESKYTPGVGDNS